MEPRHFDPFRVLPPERHERAAYPVGGDASGGPFQHALDYRAFGEPDRNQPSGHPLTRAYRFYKGALSFG